MNSRNILINGFQVRKIFAYKIRECKDWEHHVYDRKFLWKTKHYDYWTYIYEIGGRYSLEEMLKYLEEFHKFYKDGKVYQCPCIDFIFSSEDSTTVYFNTDEEMFQFLEKFKDRFGKSFIVIE